LQLTMPQFFHAGRRIHNNPTPTSHLCRSYQTTCRQNICVSRPSLPLHQTLWTRKRGLHESCRTTMPPHLGRR
jgi:hypothetical protein